MIEFSSSHNELGLEFSHASGLRAEHVIDSFPPITVYKNWIQPCSQLREFSSNHDEQGLVSSHADESLCSLPRTKSACSMIYKEKKNRVVKKENPPNEKCQSQARKKKNRQEDRLTNTRNVLIIQSKLCWIELSALRTLHESSTLWIFFLGDSITKTNSVWNDKLCHTNMQ